MTLRAASAIARFNAALDGIERPLMRECSIKAQGNTLIEGRFLVSFGRKALGPGPSQVLMKICANLGAPKVGLDQINAIQRQADSIHFGFEPDPIGDVLKCYLEFLPADASEKGLVFFALKWRLDGVWTVSRYHDRTALDHAERAALVTGILPAGTKESRIMTELALREDQPVLLEVSEAGTPRRSLDINLADAGLTIGAACDSIVGLLGNDSRAKDWSAKHADARLGHVAAGTARDGRLFTTIYFGAHAVEDAL